MTLRLLRFSACLFVVLCWTMPVPAQDHPVQPADLIVVHGRIYTENPAQPWTQAIAVRDGKIIAVGSDSSIEPLRGPVTKVLNAEGRLVLPGFVDCHIHFLDGSNSLGRVNLEGAKNPADIQNRLREYASKHPGSGWILGRGWDYSMFGADALPHKKYLDEVFPDRPVSLDGFDGHTYWANSKALALAGITRSTPDPPNGIIVRDPKSGEPTGALKEDPAQDVVRKVIPVPSRAENLAALRAGLKWANQHGITRVHSAGQDFEVLDLFDELRRNGNLTVRMYIAYFLNPPELRPEDLNAIEQARKQFHDEWLDAGAVKFMIDGVIEAHTAAMLQPYSDNPSVKGALFWDPAKYKSAVAELDKRGLQLFTHAIGDYAVHTALDAYENAALQNHTQDRRPRIEHIETVSSADIPRFGKLRVIASMQPLHARPDEDTLKIWAGAAGPDRASRAWAWKSIFDTGGRLAFGSDWPVVTLDPWEGVQVAVTRQTVDGFPPSGFLSEQKLTVAQVVDAYTLGAAFAGRREKSEGSLEVGKAADLIVLSQNIFEVDPHKIASTKVLTTVVGGRVVYHAATR